MIKKCAFDGKPENLAFYSRRSYNNKTYIILGFLYYKNEAVNTNN